MNTAMQRQPVVTVTMLTTLASAIIAGLALMLDLPSDTEKVVLGIITAAYPVVTAAWTWHKVYAPATVAEIVTDVSGDPAKADEVVTA